MRSTRRIIVVGGGSAGWLTAGLIAARHSNRSEDPVRVTLIESPQIGTIGVGEGTWPTMRTTLRQLGIPEATFLRECDATFKQGTRFVGWTDGSDKDIYYHPFTAPAGYPTTDLAPHWWNGRSALSFTDAVCAQGAICDRGLAPKQAQTPEYAGVMNYGYHLDAGRFAKLLTKHCTERLGVDHVQANITGVECHEDGDVKAVRTAERGAIEGDLFIDCSGMRSMLLGDHYDVPLVDCSDVLFNDTALAVQVPYAEPDTPIASLTISTAQRAGWIWDIGLPTRRGTGYVYSSRHADEEEGRKVLEAYLDATGTPAEARPEARRIDFRPGYRERFWHRNCVAVGMASGFIEPLEASALVMVELSARMIVDELPPHRGVMDIVARRFNEKFSYRWERIIDFLKLHYVLGRRDDSDYWRDNRVDTAMPERLRELLAVWRYRTPRPSDLPHVDEIFSAASYQYVLYGMGFEPERLMPTDDRDPGPLFEQALRATNQYATRLPTNRELLDRIAEHGLPAAG